MRKKILAALTAGLIAFGTFGIAISESYYTDSIVHVALKK